MAFDPNKLKQVAAKIETEEQVSGFDPEKLKKVNESLLSKTGKFLADKGDDLMKGLALPYEAVGEVMRVPLERGTVDDYRAPSLVQKHFPSTKTDKPAENPFSLSNKMLRAGASYIDALVKEGDPDKAADVARAAYAQDRGTLGIVEDVLLSGLTGRLAPKVANAPIDAAVKGIKAIGKGGKFLAKEGAKKAIRVGTGVSEKAQSALMNRPNAITNAKSEADIADEIGHSHKVLGKKVERIEKSIDDVLRTSPYLEEGAKPKPDVLLAIDNARKKIGLTVTDQEKYTKNILDGLSDNLKQLRNTVSEKQLRSMIQKLDDAISYGSKNFGQKDQSLSDIRRSWDRMLKTNPEYKRLVGDEVPLIRLQRGLEDKFGVAKRGDGTYGATDSTVSKVQNILKENKAIESQPILKRVGKETGRDYIQLVKDSKSAKEFEAGARPSGSRRTLLGSLVGMAAEPFVPGVQGLPTMVGGAAGATADYYGGPVAKGLITIARGAKESVKAPIKLAVEAAKKKNADIFFELLKRGIPVASTLQTSQ